MVDNNDHNTHSPGVESELLISPGTKQVLKGRRATKRVNASNDATARIPRDGTTREIASTKSRPVGDVAAFMKYGSLVLLVAQMVGLVLLMRYTRTKGAKHKSDGTVDLYLASTAVFLMEVTKLAICTVVVFVQSGYTVKGLLRAYYENICNAPLEVLKLCVPSFLYTIQNNLLYFALSNLDAATYQVCYQLKILTTALFSVILLRVSPHVFVLLCCS
jgi:hypothetical protein